MFPTLSAPALGQLATSISHAAISLAQSVGVGKTMQRVQDFFQERANRQAVNRAIEKAYRRFRRDIHYPEIVRVFDSKDGLEQHPEISALLGQIATTPLYQQESIVDLAQAFQRMAPHVTAQQCQEAARVLAESFHMELMAIPALRDDLALLRQEALEKHMQAMVDLLTPQPPFADGLDIVLAKEAKRVAILLQHDSVTTAHLFYALARLQESVTRHALARQGVTTKDVFQSLHIIDKHPAAVVVQPTNGYNKAIRHAQQLAGREGVLQTYEQHVLEALLDQVDRDEEHMGRAVRLLLDSLKISTQALRAGIHDAIHQSSHVHHIDSAVTLVQLTSDPDDK